MVDSHSVAHLIVGGLLGANGDGASVGCSSDRAQQVIRAIAERPYVGSAQICKELGITREELRAVYAQARVNPAMQAVLAKSPFYYLTKVLERLSKDEVRTTQVLRREPMKSPYETLELFISADCNVNCTFCYRRDRDYGDQRILAPAEFVAIVDEFAASGGKQMDVSGGLEPLLSPAIADVFKAGIDRGLRVNLYTIGNALHNPKIADLLMQLSQIRISFTAHDRDSYVKMMGVDHFDRVTTNARALMKRKLDTNSPVGIGTSYVVTPEVFRNIPKAVAFAVELGMEFFDLRSVSVWAADDYSMEDRAELGAILDGVRRDQARGAYGKLKVSIADTFGSITNPSANPLPYVNHDLVNMLVHYRLTVTPAGKVFPLNILGQPTREDERFLIGRVGAEKTLAEAMSGRKPIPFEPDLLLAHDKTLVIALSKLQADLDFGIPLAENPFAPQ
ncbi:MAG: radical SAM protein [Planctomycetes bacterium]|jgi:TDP-4-amino-4,6-dideoxy-D-glucose deaminase|nr:radical SAM protein [Planctomycetota bacterium]MCC7061979.1 radical SAM protein [Planctomycetota bacterium]